jgi:hypothetical protein
MKRGFFACIIATVCLFLSTTCANAITIKSETIPDSIHVGSPTTKLVLNGAGIRSKFFFSIYIGALYVPEKSHDPHVLEMMPGRKRVVMKFLYDEVSGSKLASGWEEGFVNNQSEQQMSGLRSRLDKFKQLFPTVHKGDVIWLDYIPGSGTQVRVNTRLRGGNIQGADFYRALLQVWLGEEPADSDLKRAMLGSEEED